MKGWVTINTDAGYYKTEKLGSFAYWIKGDNMFFRGSGILKEECKSATEAEIKAIINAVHILIASGRTDIIMVVVNRDAKNAYPDQNGSKYQKILYQKLHELRELCSVPGYQDFFSFRWVKAHQRRIKNSRSWVNQWLDTQCSIQLRNHVKKVRQ